MATKPPISNEARMLSFPRLGAWFRVNLQKRWAAETHDDIDIDLSQDRGPKPQQIAETSGDQRGKNDKKYNPPPSFVAFLKIKSPDSY